MQTKSIVSFIIFSVFLVGLTMNTGFASGQNDIPKNMDQGLRRLVELYRKDPQVAYQELKEPRNSFLPPIQHDARAEKPLVAVSLDGTMPADTVASNLKKIGFEVTAISQAQRGGLEGYVPIGQATEVAQVKGVRSISAVFRPIMNSTQAPKSK
jgi:hypothetical protein